MSEQAAQILTEADVFVFTRDYYGRRIEITCKDAGIFKDAVLTGKVAWYDESNEDDELGITLEDVIILATDEKLPGIALRCSDVESFTPLEEKNSAEDIERLWPSKQI